MKDYSKLLATANFRLMTKEEFFYYRDETKTLPLNVVDNIWWWLADDEKCPLPDDRHEAVNASCKYYLRGCVEDDALAVLPIVEVGGIVPSYEMEFYAFGRKWVMLDERNAFPMKSFGLCIAHYNIDLVIREEIEKEYPKMYCHACGALIDSDEFEFKDGLYWCSDECLEKDETYTKCPKCGKIIYKEELYHVEDTGETVCGNCVWDSEDYFWCSECNKVYSSAKKSATIPGTCVNCESVFIVCADCGCRERKKYAVEINGEFICQPCANGNVENLLSYHDDDADYSVFHNVGNDGIEYAKCIKNELYLGYENEVDNGWRGSRLVKDVNSKFNHMFCMHDGSLSSRGIELISQPATLAWHEKFGNYEELLDMCEERGYDSEGNCGLHVHVSRDFFGYGDTCEYNIAKLILLVNKFWDKRIVPFTRRDMYHLSEWAGQNDTEDVFESDTEESVIRKVSAVADESGRYKAINTQNSNTIEFRIFKSTTCYRTLIATLQFVDTICRYVKSHNLKQIDECKWEDIFDNCGHKELMYELKKLTNYGDRRFHDNGILKK